MLQKLINKSISLKNTNTKCQGDIMLFIDKKTNVRAMKFSIHSISYRLNLNSAKTFVLFIYFWL
jgi:hypothetical protein